MIRTSTFFSSSYKMLENFSKRFIILLSAIICSMTTYAQVVNISVSPESISTSATTGNSTDEILTITNTGNAPLEYSLEFLGEVVSFSKADYADHTQIVNQDRITNNVSIVRANNQGIFNIAQEGSYSGSSPIDTEWAYGKTADLSPIDYSDWRTAVDWNPPAMVGNTMSMHIISSDKYYDFEWLGWSENSSGGGFSYKRTEIPFWLTASSMTGTIAGSASEAITLTLDATSDLPDGTYSVSLIINSNAGNSPKKSIPIEFVVSGGTPIISTTASILFSDVIVGNSGSTTLDIFNDGLGPLDITDITSDNGVFTPSVSSLSIPGYSYASIEVSFNPDMVQNFTGNLTLTSNDAGGPTMITLDGNGLASPTMTLSLASISETLAFGNTASQILTIGNTGDGDLEWTADLVIPNSEVAFTKEDYADFTLAENQDRVTNHVWITRAEIKGIFNIKTESGYNGGISPEGTEWAYGKTTELTPIDYTNWINAVSSNPRGQIGQTISMHEIATNRYFDVLFNKFTGNENGGGFGYTRKEIPGWLTLGSYSGIVTSATTSDVSVDFNANIAAGEYEAQLIISTNDPSQPSAIIPVTISISGTPEISIVDTSVDFGDVYIGYDNSFDLEIENTGSDVLDISDISSNNADFTVSSTTANIAATESGVITIKFTPTSNGIINGTLSITSNDPANSPFDITVTGNALTPPSIAITHNVFTLDILGGGTLNENINIANTQGEDLVWSIGSDYVGDLNSVLVALDANFADVVSMIPNSYNFSYDGGPNYINDGGNDMYDGGNYIGTDLSIPIDYSDDLIIDGTGFFGDGTSYFTRHLPGLFVLAADLNGVTEFRVTGELGADGNGSADKSIIELAYGNKNYTGFIKRVYNSGDPSVNHLIIIESTTGVTQVISENTNSDSHTISGLGDTDRLYYLLYAGTNSDYINDNQAQDIMKSFLSAVSGVPSFITLSANSGVTVSGSDEDITININSIDVPSDLEGLDLLVNSNDPANQTQAIPITFTGNTAPEIVINPGSISFGNTFIGYSKTLNLNVKNTGSSTLDISSISIDNGLFSIVETSLSLAPKESQNIEVTFTPDAEGVQNGNITFTTNDLLNPTVDVLVDGEGLIPPVMMANPDIIQMQLFAGEVGNETITIENIEGSDLDWVVSANINPTATNALISLNDNFNDVLSVIPNRYIFNYDGGNHYIDDGGGDMYDQGNYLSTDLLGGFINYSDDVLANGNAVFGTGTSYFTRHLDGLFVLGADLNGANTFTISGELGADGSGSTDKTILEVDFNGKTYLGFVKRVHSAGDPSVNHLIIVEKMPGITQTTSNNTDNDFHSVAGLNANDKLFYLLYAGTSGAYINDVETENIMTTFLATVTGFPSYISVSPLSGTTTAGNTDNVTISVTADDVPVSRVQFDILVTGNDPITPEKIIPFDLQVGGIFVDNDIADVLINEGFGSTLIDLSNVFVDAEDDPLTFIPASSKEDVVGVSVSGSELTVTELSIGTSMISLSASDGNGNSAFANFSFRVNAVPVVANALTDQVYDNAFASATFDLSNVFSDADLSDVLSYSVTNSDNAVVTAALDVNALTITEVGAGTTIISITADDGSGGQVVEEFEVVVNKIDQSIVFDALATKVYGDTSFDLTATGGGSGNAITYTSSDANVAIVTGGTVTVVGAGSTTITASQAGNAAYHAAIDVIQVLEVTQAPLIVTADDQFKTYGENLPTLTLTYTGLVNGDDASAITTTPTVTTTADMASSAGNYIITVSGGAAANYELASYIEGTLTVNKAPLTVTANDQFKLFGEDLPTLTVTYSGLVNGDDASVITTPPTVATTANVTSPAGTYNITASDGAAANYELTNYIDGTLTIETVTGTEFEIVENSKIRFYPNPAEGVIYISVDEAAFDLMIFDNSGKLVMQQKSVNSDEAIIIDHLKKGMYFLFISTDSKLIRQNFIKE